MSLLDLIKKIIKPKPAAKVMNNLPVYVPPEPDSLPKLPAPLPVKCEPAELRFEYYKAKQRIKRKIRNHIAKQSKRINYYMDS
jgi:hypothetical protein